MAISNVPTTLSDTAATRVFEIFPPNLLKQVLAFNSTIASEIVQISGLWIDNTRQEWLLVTVTPENKMSGLNCTQQSIEDDYTTQRNTWQH